MLFNKDVIIIIIIIIIIKTADKLIFSTIGYDYFTRRDYLKKEKFIKE